MAEAREAFGGVTAPDIAARASPWRFSLPLLVGVYVYLYTLYDGHVRNMLLLDGDTYWHIAAGHWIWQNGTVPAQDPFSHTMRGAPWTAHEWLSQLVLARVHDLGGWNAVVALTGLAFATSIALLTRALLRALPPARALLFAVIAVMMTANHVLARPHMIAMPLMMIWMIELVRARDEDRSPSLWLLPVMALWANLHGGFTLGMAVAVVLAFDALLAARQKGAWRGAAKAWALFLVLAAGSALLTPYGAQGFRFTWQVLVQDTYALDRVNEWASPNFHYFQPLEVWLIGGLALVMHQGLRLPPVRLFLVLGFLHLALKHARSIELLGLIVPLLVAAPFAAQWHEAHGNARPPRSFLNRLIQPAGSAAVAGCLVALLALSTLASRVRPVEPPAFAAPAQALEAVRRARITGPVLNDYGLGGYLIYSGIAPSIDGRSDMYRDDFVRRHFGAMELSTPDGLEKILDQYKITWTLLRPGTPAIGLLDHLPGWRRVYADQIVVVHARTAPDAAAGAAP